MGELYTIKDRAKSNAVYSLFSRLKTDEIINRRPELFYRGKGMAAALAASQDADGRLKEKIRKLLPADVSPRLIPSAERLVNEAGEALRKDLLDLFFEEIDIALEQKRK